MIKILITGFMHSGTTLLHQLVKAHPQVGWIENEKNYIEYDKPKQWILMMASKQVSNPNQYAWGEKIPYKQKGGAERACSLIHKWKHYFTSEAKILNIVRHPIDVALSSTAERYEYNTEYLNLILDVVPKVCHEVNQLDEGISLVYEELLEDPYPYLKSIFSFLTLKDDEDTISNIIDSVELKFNKINADRAYAFRKKGLEDIINYNDIINNMKSIKGD